MEEESKNTNISENKAIIQNAGQTELNEQVVQDIIELLKNPKIEVKKGTMLILLQCSGNPDKRRFFDQTEVMKLMLRYITEPTIETTALSNLINFSQDTVFQKQIIELNGVSRIADNIKELMANIQKSGQNVIEKKQQLQIELSSLILINITEGEAGAKQFMQVDQGELSGHYFQILLELFCSVQYHNLMRFVPNILVNGSQIEEGRKIMIHPQHQIITKVIVRIFDPERNTRICLLKLLRNCIFEYENKEFCSQIFSKQSNLLDNITIYLLHIIYTCHQIGFDEKQKQQSKQLLQSFGINDSNVRFQLNKNQTKEKEIEEIEISSDILLVLSNVDLNALKPEFNDVALIQTVDILNQIKYPQEEIKNKFEVINATYQIKRD